MKKILWILLTSVAMIALLFDESNAQAAAWSDVVPPFIKAEVDGIAEDWWGGWHHFMATPTVMVDQNGDIHIAEVYSRQLIEVNATNNSHQQVETQLYYRKQTAGAWDVQQQVTSYPMNEAWDAEPALPQMGLSQVAMDSAGMVHFVYLYRTSDSEQLDLYYVYQTSTGWSTPENLSNSPGVYTSAPQIAIDQNDNIYAFWRDTGSGVQYRINTSGAWSAAQFVPTIYHTYHVIVDTTNILHIIGHQQTTNDVYHLTYTAGSWSAPEYVTTGILTKIKMCYLHGNPYVTGAYYVGGNRFTLLSKPSGTWVRQEMAWPEITEDQFTLWGDIYGNLQVIYVGNDAGQPHILDRVYDGTSWSAYRVISPEIARTGTGQTYQADLHNSTAAIFFAGWDENNEETFFTSAALSDLNAIPLTSGVAYNGSTVDKAANFNNYSCQPTLDESGPEVVHRLTITTASNVTIALTNLAANLDLFLLSSPDPSNCLRFSAGIGDETISYNTLPPGTYFIVVDGYDGASSAYSLTATAVPLPDDVYETNDALATAWYPGYKWENTWLSTINGSGIQLNDDWYRIEVSPDYERLLVECQFTHANGDMDLELYDADGGYVAGSAEAADTETLDVVVPAAGTYYLRVYQANLGNTYNLWWDDISLAEINIKQDTTDIPTGTGSYNFGGVTVGSYSTTLFTLENLGPENLNLTGTPIVAISDAQASDFQVLQDPITPVAPNDLTTFIIQFTPQGAGIRTATISIASNDHDEASYTFTVTGTGTLPEINVKQGTTSLQSGTGNYVFGTVNVGSSSTAVTFTIENLGTANLTLTDIQKSGSHPNDFTVTQPLTLDVIPGGSTNFTVTFVPTATGTRTATISIANNDSDENPYTFTVTGTGQQASNSYLLWTK